MLVRQARPEDAAAIEGLYRALVAGDENIRVDGQRIAQLEGDATNHLFVLEGEGAVRGTAFLTICLDPMYGFIPYGVVENVVVEASLRGAGAGRALMEAVEREARAARCTKLMLLSSAFRTDAHRFFARLGYDGEKKRGFIKYLNRSSGPRAPG
jgi:N-acetylglutamate synthase-like GNAT family acetyltransferase